MKKLIELLKLSTDLKGKILVETANSSIKSKGSKVFQLIEGIARGAVIDDKSACILLYNNENMISSTTYNSLKMRALSILKQNFLLQDEKRLFKTTRKREEFISIRDSSLVNLLLLTGSDETALYIARKGIGQAERNQLAYEAAVFSELIATEEAFKGRQKAFEKSSANSIRWLEQLLAEKKSRSFFERVMSWYAARWTLTREHVPLIDSFINQIESWSITYTSDSLNIDLFRLRRVRAEIVQDYNATVRLVEEVESYYDLNPRFRSRHILGAFNTSAMGANMWLGNLEGAWTCANRCAQLLDEGTTNWYTYQEYHLMLCLREHDDIGAQKVFTAVQKRLLNHDREDLHVQKWMVFEFYLRFILSAVPSASLLPPSYFSEAPVAKRFRDFKAAMSHLTRDKAGFGIICVFAQILFLLHHAQFSTLIARDESLQTYRRKRLNPLNYRITQLARMIHIMVSCGFDYEKTKRRTEKLLQTIRTVPEQYRSASAETLEFIPLADLWMVMMKELETVQERL